MINPNNKLQMTNEIQNQNFKKRYDLEERTAKYGIQIIQFVNKIPKNPINLTLITQLMRSGTSIGANYCEADGAESKKDFIHKIGICKKESKETKYWLRMIGTTLPEFKEEARLLWKEAQELTLIFSAIIRH